MTTCLISADCAGCRERQRGPHHAPQALGFTGDSLPSRRLALCPGQSHGEGSRGQTAISSNPEQKTGVSTVVAPDDRSGFQVCRPAPMAPTCGGERQVYFPQQGWQGLGVAGSTAPWVLSTGGSSALEGKSLHSSQEPHSRVAGGAPGEDSSTGRQRQAAGDLHSLSPQQSAACQSWGGGGWLMMTWMTKSF